MWGSKFSTTLTLDHCFSPPDIYPNRNLIAESTTLSITLFAIYWQMPPCSNYIPQQQISIYSLYLHTTRKNQYLLFLFADINNITYDVWSFVLVVGEPVFRPLVKIIAFSYSMLSSRPDLLFQSYHVVIFGWLKHLIVSIILLTSTYFRSTWLSTSVSWWPMTTSIEAIVSQKLLSSPRWSLMVAI